MLLRPPLKSALEANFASPTDNRSVAAAKIANAYYTYSLGAQSCSGVIIPAPMAAKQQALAKGLESAMVGVALPQTMNMMASAFTAYWLGAAFAGPTPGVVTVVVPVTLQLALTSVVLSSLNAPASIVAAKWADALDTWTKTIIAVHAPPAACAGPLM